MGLMMTPLFIKTIKGQFYWSRMVEDQVLTEHVI